MVTIVLEGNITLKFKESEIISAETYMLTDGTKMVKIKLLEGRFIEYPTDAIKGFYTTSTVGGY